MLRLMIRGWWSARYGKPCYECITEILAPLPSNCVDNEIMARFTGQQALLPRCQPLFMCAIPAETAGPQAWSLTGCVYCRSPETTCKSGLALVSPSPHHHCRPRYARKAVTGQIRISRLVSALTCTTTWASCRRRPPRKKACSKSLMERVLPRPLGRRLSCRKKGVHWGLLAII